MEEREIQEILIEILYAAVNEVVVDPEHIQRIANDNLASVYRLAKKHDLAHIVSSFVYQNNIEVKNEELRARLEREEMVAVYRYEQMKYSFEQICKIFDEARISYVPLKGAVIRAYYPYEHMRTSCDIDILIHEEDLDSAVDCLEKKGYRFEKKNYHDVSLFSPNRTHLELHFNVCENMDSLDVVLKDAWKYATLDQGSRYEFSKAFFVLHMYAHMAYHFLSGGCGIRSLLDIWIMEHRMDAHYSCAEDLLKKAGIYTFASEMSNIANACFTYNERDSFSALVLKYIYGGGVYGTKSNHIAVRKADAGNAIVYVCRRLFLPYKSMVVLYPILKKQPLLLPACWLVRCVSAVFKGKTKKVVSEVASAKNVSENKISELDEMRSRLRI